MSPRWKVRPLEHDDWEAWSELYSGYCRFYERQTSDEHLRLIWSWIHERGSIECLVAVPADGNGDPIGLAHLRPWIRPLRGIVCGYLDDLFVADEFRGTGAVEALFEGISALAVEHDWPLVRWTTADDNYRARAVYDRLATRTTWITYDMTIDT